MSSTHGIIKLRRGTEAEWAASLPQPGGEVLRLGEPGYEKDTRKLKIGDGVTPWNSLPYFGNGAVIDPEDLQDLIGDGFLVAGTGINISYNDGSDSLTISTSGVSFSNHSHGLISNSGTITGLLTDINIGGPLSWVTTTNSIVKGVFPVKDIVGGSGINVSSLSGTYTVAVTGVSELISEEVDDRVSQLLVEGTGVNLTYNDASGTLTIDNLHSEINILSQEPQGFVNRTDSVLSFDDSSRTFTIQPAISGGSYSIYVEGTKIVKNTVETVVLGSGTALNYIHFDTISPYALQTKTTGFNFDTDVPIAFIHWNSDINQSTFFGEERHGIRMDSVTHKWIHNTFGIQYINGLSIGGYTLLGNGSSNTHAQIDISDGILYQEDIIIDITNDNGINSANEFVQQLNPIAYIPTYYHSGSTGQWVRDTATAFPLKYNATRAQYNLYSGGTWTTPNVGDKKYFAMWIVATNDMDDPILAIVGQREDSSLIAAESNNNWNNINLTNIPTQEIRPLYRLIFTTDNTFTNTPKSSLQSILDIRVAIQSTIPGVVQNDHGILFGLADDDHYQYMHIDNNRTISALHTFSNGLNASGLINAASGNFTTLSVSGVFELYSPSVTGCPFVLNIPNQNDDVGAFKIIGSDPDIFLDSYAPGSGYPSSVTNLDNGVFKTAAGYNPWNDSYFISRYDSGTWYDNTFNINRSNGVVTIGTTTESSGIDSGALVLNGGLGVAKTITATSGNFSALFVNSTGVSLVGHTHTASNITDFDSSVSGIINTSLSTDIIAGTGISITYDNINDDLIISSDGLVRVIDLGAISGVYPISAGIYNSIQTLSLNGTSVNFTKGTDWPATSTSSTDTVLKMSVSAPTSITWTLVTQWFNRAASPISSGDHLFLLRGVGTSVVEGHYIGNQT